VGLDAMTTMAVVTGKEIMKKKQSHAKRGTGPKPKEQLCAAAEKRGSKKCRLSE